MNFVSVKDKLRKFDKLRKSKMAKLEGVFHNVIRNNDHCQSQILTTSEVKRILIVRNNTRIGNALFLLPFVRQVRDSFPDAHITLMLHNPFLGQIFDNLGVNEICYSQLSFKHANKTFNLIKKLKKEPFDIIFSPYNSAEDAAICALLPSRNKIGPVSPTRENAFSHTFTNNSAKGHAALNSLYLLPSAGFDSQPTQHTLALSEEEQKVGQKEFAKISSPGHANDVPLYLAYFRGARGEKRLPESYWTNLLERIEQQVERPVEWIEILSPDIPEPLNNNVQTFSSPNIRHLASFLTNVDAFICCDTGPLHLADAANVPCIGLYNKTCTTTFGLLNKQSICITDIEQFDVKHALTMVGALAQ